MLITLLKLWVLCFSTVLHIALADNRLDGDIKIIESTSPYSSSSPGRATSHSPFVTGPACPRGSLLRVDFKARDGDGRLYGNTHAGAMITLEEGDVFEYEIMWNEADCNCGVDFEIGSAYRHRDHGSRDALGFSPHSEFNENMSVVAYKQWYLRQWSLANLAGKYVDKFVFSSKIPPGEQRTAFFKYIRIRKGGGIRRAVFDSGQEAPTIEAYMPGSIVTSCQPIFTVQAQLDNLLDHSLASGSRIVLSGHVTARSISDTANIEADMCVAGETWLREEPHSIGVRIKALGVTVRHKDHDGMILWRPYFREFLTPQRTPLPFWIPIDLPRWTPLSHLLNSSLLEVAVTYYSDNDSTDLLNSTLFSRPISVT